MGIREINPFLSLAESAEVELFVYEGKYFLSVNGKHYVMKGASGMEVKFERSLTDLSEAEIEEAFS